MCSTEKNLEKKGRPTGILCPRVLEKENVINIYNQIASHFSQTRHSPWPNVKKFVDQLLKGDKLLDIGCGNGKYLYWKNGTIKVGCDASTGLLDICSDRSMEVCAANCLLLPFRNESFDAAISIAVFHHVASKERRLYALGEMIRILRKGGQGLIYVWALEQKRKGKKSAYLKKDGKCENDEESRSVKNGKYNTSTDQNIQQDTMVECNKNKPFKDHSDSLNKTENYVSQSTNHNDDSSQLANLTIHTNKTEFMGQDVLVPWKLKSNIPKKEKIKSCPNEKSKGHCKIKKKTIKKDILENSMEDTEKGAIDTGDDVVGDLEQGNCLLNKSDTVGYDEKGDIEKVFHRFYHVFKEGELDSMFDEFSCVKILQSYYDEGNWCILFEKIT